MHIGLAIIIINIIIGAVAMHYIEKWDWIDSTYFAVVTMATIGYGDLTPKTREGKLFVIFYIIWAVSTTLYALTLIARAYLEKYYHVYERIAQMTLKPYYTIKNVSIPKALTKLKYRYKKRNNLDDIL